MSFKKKTETRTVSGPYSKVQVVTLSSFDAGDKFKLQYAGSKTAFIESGVNATAAAIQALLRTLTGDATLTCTGTTDAGPFTVTFVSKTGDQITDILTVTDATGSVTGVVKASLDSKAVSLRASGGPAKVYRVKSSTTSAQSPTYEVTETGPDTTELADESPASVVINSGAGTLCDGVATSGNGFIDGDTVTFDIYYETTGDARF